MLQPREQPGQTESSEPRYHTRILKRKSLSVRAPTGQMSTTLPEYLLSSSLPGYTLISDWSPRLKIPKSWVFVISSPKRTQREHKIQRSWSSITVGPMEKAFFVFLTFISSNFGS